MSAKSLMTVSACLDNLSNALVARRSANPKSLHFLFAEEELSRIIARVNSPIPLDEEFYQSVSHGIGLMCARELEASDMEFCELVYRAMTLMKEDIKRRGGFSD